MKHWLLLILIAILLPTGCNRGESDTPTETLAPPVQTTDEVAPPVAQNDVGQGTTVATPGPDSSTAAPDFAGPTSNRPPTRFGTQRVLQIDHLLTRGEVREVTHFAGALQELELEGQAPSPTYNSVRFAGEGHLGVGLQVWEFSSSAATTRHFERLRDTYVDPRGTRTVGDGGFRSDFPGIRQIVFMSRSRNVVIAIACDDTICEHDGEIAGLAEKIEDRL